MPYFIDLPNDRKLAKPFAAVVGWIADKHSCEEVVFCVNGASVPHARIDRPDVREAYPGQCTLGFSLQLEMSRYVTPDASKLVLTAMRGESVLMSVDFEIDSALREACERGSRARAAKRQWCLEHIQCPNCGAGGLLIEQSAITCRSCRTFFPQETGALNFLTPELYDRCLLRHTDNVASNNYDELAARMIDDVLERGGKILDCGAGSRPEISEAVVNLEIVAYPSTDVLGVGQALPFRDASFDAIFSFAVLEHVSDPFRCAAEMVRVLKPGGKIYAHVPFLQPEHGYPNHFYNMTRQGVANLFRGLTVEQHFVPASGVPIWALHWMVEQYALQLSPSAKDRFLSMRIRDILAKRPIDYLEDPIVTELSTDGNWILASTTAIIATKQSTIQM